MSSAYNQPLKLLLAFDGSEHSHAAISMLCELCALGEVSSPAVSITALAVFTPLMAGDQGPLRDSLAWAHSYLEGKCFQVSSDLVLGYPAEKIVEYAEQLHPDLIVMGAKGLRATLGILLGGVAQQVVEYANCPVLIVRAPYTGLNRILLVTDGSPHSLKATRYLAEFPLPKTAEVRILHVLPPAPLRPLPEYFARTYPLAPEVLPVYPSELTQEEKQWRAQEERNGELLLEQAAQIFKEVGRETSTVLLRGDTATEIIQYVKDNKIDLIVSGSRGLSQVKSWLLGSVSRKLVHYSGCSVLVVKGAPEASA